MGYDPKTFWEYRDMIISAARKKFIRERQIADVAISLMCAVIVGAIITIIDGAGVIQTVILPIIVFAGIYAGCYAHYLDMQPVEVYNKQQLDMGKLEQEKIALEEMLKPKFNIEYGEGGNFQHRYKGRVLYRIAIKNTSSYAQLENVHVYLSSIDPSVLKCLPAHLHLMNDNVQPNNGEIRWTPLSRHQKYHS